MISNSTLEGIFGALDVSTSGMSAQRARLDAIASNIANIHTTRTEEGGYYKKRIVVFESKIEKKGFKSMLDEKISRGEADSLAGVRVSEIQNVESEPKMVYEPSHPDADADGFVSYPNINIVEEMVEMIMASRIFEANLTVFNAAKSMISQSLEI